MNIDIIIQKITDIEFGLKKISEERVSNKTDGIVLGAMGAFLAVSVAEFPRWISFVGLVAVSGKLFHVYTKWKKSNEKYDAICISIYDNLKELRKVCDNLVSDDISGPAPVSTLPFTDNSKIPHNLASILTPLQRLENTAFVAFGDKFYKNVSDEIERVFRKYQVEFLDYSEETKDCYDVEEADIEKISYALKAVVKKNRSIEDRESPIILKGKVFIPKIR